MLFKLTCQKSGWSLLRGNVVMNRRRERGRGKAAACQWEKVEQKKILMAKDWKPPPAQSQSPFNYHQWHMIDVSFTEGCCMPSHDPRAFLVEMGSPFTSRSFLSTTLSHTETFSPGNLSSWLLCISGFSPSHIATSQKFLPPLLYFLFSWTLSTSPTPFLPIRYSLGPLTLFHTHSNAEGWWVRFSPKPHCSQRAIQKATLLLTAWPPLVLLSLYQLLWCLSLLI